MNCKDVLDCAKKCVAKVMEWWNGDDDNCKCSCCKNNKSK